MKKWLCEPKYLFSLLMYASVVAIVAGVYLGFVLGTPMPGASRVLPFLGMAFWCEAWCEFIALCVRLRRGERAFTVPTGKALRRIGICMTGLAAVTISSALIGGTRLNTGYWALELILLPGLFLAVAVVAKILRGLLTHAMSIEKEQEGVV